MMSQELAVQGSWLDLASSWSGIVSAALAVLAVTLGFWVSSSIYQTYALLNRRRKYIAPVVRRAGMCKSRFRFIITGRRLLSLRVRSAQFQVRDELAWLSALNPTLVPEDGLSAAYPVPLPFTFALPEAEYGSVMGQMAAAYTEYASSVRRRWLLRSAAGPLTVQEHDCAQATASLLSRWSSFEPVQSRATASKLRGMKVELGCGHGPLNTRLITWPHMDAQRVIPGFPVIGVSYQPYRVVMEGSPAAKSDADQKVVRVVARPAGTAAATPLFYDGVLPRWHGTGFRIEIDRITGRQKLHLCISETTYFAFQATQSPSAIVQAGDAALCSRLLSLSLLALDQDDVAILIRRSDHVVYPRKYSGTVTGNCELTSREGLRADLDQHGLPDLMGAVAREAREELGIDFTSDDSQLAALGVIEYSGESEIETHALVATARLPVSARDFRVARSAPDPAEGLWEIGDEFIAVDLRAVLGKRRSGESFVNWIRSSDEISPPGAGSLLLLVAARLELQENLAARTARNTGDPYRNPWSSDDLERWLSAPLPARPVRPGNYVSRHPLWK
jgi:hypothetical protein